MYEKGLGIEMDYKKAIDLYERGAELNEKNSLYIMGLIYLNGLYNKFVDIDRALSFLEKADRKGNSQATLKLGEIYYYGYSTITPSYKKALKYFQKIEKENLKALYYIGLMTINGQGVRKNHIKGFNIVYKSAIGGDDNAQLEIGKFYMEGKIIEKNYEAAIKWFKIAAKTKIEDAAFYIAQIYSDENFNGKAILDINRKELSQKEFQKAKELSEENIKEIFQ